MAKKTENAPEEKKAPAKKPAEKKETSAKKPAEKKEAPAKKPAEKKETPAKKPAEKKETPAKKPTEKKETSAKKPAEKKTTSAKKPTEKKATSQKSKKPAKDKTLAAELNLETSATKVVENKPAKDKPAEQNAPATEAGSAEAALVPVVAEDEKALRAAKAEAKKAEKAADDEAKKAEKAAAAEAKKAERLAEEKAKELEKAAKEAATAQYKAEQKAEKEKKRNAVLTTGQYLGMIILLLIPGVNLICVILWAIGAAKNRNRINFARGTIDALLISVVVLAILVGAGYIYADQNKEKILAWADAQTGGIVSYFEIKDFSDYKKLSKLPSSLKEKEEETTEPVTVPKVNYIYNPEGIDSYETFITLWDAQFEKNTEVPVSEPATEPSTTETTTTQNGETAVPETKPATLFEILEAQNVDLSRSSMVYIIIDNDDEHCVIVFDPAGKLQSYPSIQINNEIIYIGGTK